jgi:phage baseplate assembly protein W
VTAASNAFGRGVAFPPRLEKGGAPLASSEGADNVRESVRIILTTEPGERLARPLFGAGLGRFLGEPNSASTWRLIRDRVERALADWEPRVRVESVEVGADPNDPGAATVSITYRLVATGGRARLGLTVPLAPNAG